MDYPEGLLHHVAEVEPWNYFFLPGGPPSGVSSENPAQFALSGSLPRFFFFIQGSQV